MSWRHLLRCRRNSASPFSPYPIRAVKVRILEFLNGVGGGLEAHVGKIKSEIGDFNKLLVTRTLGLKKPCKHRKLILKYTHKYRLGLWRPELMPQRSYLFRR